MESRFSPEDHLAKLTQDWLGTVLIIGAILFPGLEFMDYFVSPDMFARFMMYRLIIAGIFLFLYYLNRLKRGKAYQYTIASVATALCAITIELAVLQSGGQNSTYYAAMIILAICGLGFVPISMPLAFVLVGIVYGIYIIPIALTEQIAGGVFISNNAFLISSFVMGLLLRYNNQKLIMTELQLRAELFEDKRKLEAYSLSLKDQVVEQAGALRISEQKYRALFDNATDGIALLDGNGTIRDVNQKFCSLHGFAREEILGANFSLLKTSSIEQEGYDERLQRILRGASVLYEAEHQRKDGGTVQLEISARTIDIGGVIHIQTFHRDITEKKQLQEQAIQSQKMESMGVLAGGIAHDFNNTLTAILGHTEVLRRRISSDDFGLRRIKTIEDAAKRAGLMVSKLLSFARKESLELVPTDLNAVVMDTMELLGRACIDRNISVQTETEPGIPAVSGDSIHLEQVITNLVMNAMDAMPGGGALTITTSAVDVGAQAQVRPFLPPGRYVVLTVGDTGTGIPPEIRQRIFEPFFTTKPVGKGTGLGLAMVYGIVKSHQGEVWVRSEPNVGTSFEIYLPSLDRPAGLPHPEFAGTPLYAAAGNECILVVDDEQDVLSYVKDTLDAHGYKTLATDSPMYAQELFHAMADHIDLVITDMVMPLLSGAELSRQFKAKKGNLKVIGISGFAGGTIASEATDIDVLIKKPFDGAKLLTTIRSVLDERMDEKTPAT